MLQGLQFCHPTWHQARIQLLSIELKSICCIYWLVFAVGTSATYLPLNGRDIGPSVYEKSNIVRPQSSAEEFADLADRRQHRTAYFRDDAEIARYLKGQGRQLMLWRCRNAIQQPYYRHKPLSFIELFCDVIGAVQTVTWSYRGLQIAGTDFSLPQSASPDANRYWQTVATHYDDGRYYAAWLDFRLRIYNVTRRDSGIYWFRATSPGGDVEQHAVFVDIAPIRHPAVMTSSRLQQLPSSSKMVTEGQHRKHNTKLNTGKRPSTSEIDKQRLPVATSDQLLDYKFHPGR